MPQLVLTDLIEDNSLRSNVATTNYGGNATTFIGYYGSGVWRAVMRFALGDLPSAAVVTSALLSVTQYGRAESTTAGTAQLHRIKERPLPERLLPLRGGRAAAGRRAA